jgi:uncharacterized membrane protein
MSTKKSGGLKSIFFAGLMAMLPLVITLYLLKVLYSIVVSNLTPIFNRISVAYNVALPESLTGITAILLFLIFLFVIGLLSKMFIGKWLLGFLDKLISGIPVAKSIYKAIRQLVDSFGSSAESFSKVVLVEFPHTNVYCVGLVVKDSQNVIEDVIGEPCYNTFVPTAPNPTSGFITVIPKRNCIDLPLSVEEGIKFIFSLGIINFDSRESAEKFINGEKTHSK